MARFSKAEVIRMAEAIQGVAAERYKNLTGRKIDPTNGTAQVLYSRKPTSLEAAIEYGIVEGISLLILDIIDPA